MEVKLLGEKHAVLVRIQGELDHHLAGELREAIDETIRRTNAVNVIFDFGSVGFMDSSGIGMIMGRYKVARALGGQVYVFGANTQIKRIIEMSGIRKIVNVSDSYEQMIKQIG